MPTFHFTPLIYFADVTCPSPLSSFYMSVKKWVSLDSSVMDALSEEDKLSLGKALKFQGSEGLFNPDTKNTDKVSALGIAWFVLHDIFKLPGADQPALGRGTFVTKRAILRRVRFGAPSLNPQVLCRCTPSRARDWHNGPESEKKELADLKLKCNELLRCRKRYWDLEVPEDIARDFKAWLARGSGHPEGFPDPQVLVDKAKAVKSRENHIFGAHPHGHQQEASAARFSPIASHGCSAQFGFSKRREHGLTASSPLRRPSK